MIFSSTGKMDGEQAIIKSSHPIDVVKPIEQVLSQEVAPVEQQPPQENVDAT